MNPFLAILLLVVVPNVLAKLNDLKGYLIYPSDGGLEKLDLKTKISKRIFNLPMHGYIKNLSKAEKDNLIFFGYLFKEGPGEFIYELNLKTEKAKVLTEGYAPTFIPTHNGYYYFSIKHSTSFILKLVLYK